MNEDSLTDLWNNIKCTNVHIIKIPEGEERQRRVKNVFDEIVAEHFLKETDIQVQKAQRVPNKMNPKRPIWRHIIIKGQN